MKIHYRPWALLLLHTPNLSLHLGRTDNLATHEKRSTFLQSIGEELVQLGHLGGDAEVDGAVGNLDDETANDLRVDLTTISSRNLVNIETSYLVGDLQGLALANKLRL